MVHFVRIKEPKDIEKVISTMINRILTSDDSLLHAGRLANLCNSWTYTHRLLLDSQELKVLKERLDKIEAEAKLCDH
jgi:hypothetical protein